MVVHLLENSVLLENCFNKIAGFVGIRLNEYVSYLHYSTMSGKYSS